MERIQVRVELEVSQQTDELFSHLNDFESYHLWWPERFQVRSEGDNAVVFTVGPGIWVGWKREAFQAHNRVDYTYHIGPHTGTGTWSLQPTSAGTKAILDIDVQPKNLWVALLYKIIGFSNKHTSDIEQLVQDLSRFIESDSRKENSHNIDKLY